jgi:4-hydroxy-3-methylbut-2-enyl diphosphate reductase
LIKEPPTSDICYATTNRQAAVRQIAPECDLVLVIGSVNSSNSVRLTEISRNVGTPAYLLDDARGLREEWFPKPDATVLITAGASAPEDLVAELCRTLLSQYGGTIEQRSLVDEDMEFALPITLRRLAQQEGQTLRDESIRVATPTISRELYGAVPLTVSARN